MNKYKYIYFAILLILVTKWLSLHANDIRNLIAGSDFFNFGIIVAIYLFSHFLRMLRLVLFTLDHRDRTLPLLRAHALTAFISSLLPFKLGEILRLFLFFEAFSYKRKALAVWLSERFSDIIAITFVILVLYLFNFNLSSGSRLVLLLSAVVACFCLASIISVAKLFKFINRHFVMNSHTNRTLMVLRFSHQVRQLENDIYRSVNGRLSVCLLLSILLWVLDVCALALSINQPSVVKFNLVESFTAGLFAILPGSVLEYSAHYYMYQPAALIILTAILPIFIVVSQAVRKINLNAGVNSKQI